MSSLIEDRDKLQTILDDTSHVVFFGGAGVSTESGIPDFRSEDGLYHQKYDYPPEVILSHSFFCSHPEEFYRFYKEKMLPLDCKPNAAHLFLAELEKVGKLKAVITQNIDGLHQKAGSKRVLELHGSIHRNHCVCCHQFFEVSTIVETAKVPLCPFCGGIIKPDVVLYDEPLDEQICYQAIQEIENADILIVAGTSLSVYPAASFVDYFKGRHLILINNTPSKKELNADVIIYQKVGELFAQLHV